MPWLADVIRDTYSRETYPPTYKNGYRDDRNNRSCRTTTTICMKDRRFLSHSVTCTRISVCSRDRQMRPTDAQTCNVRVHLKSPASDDMQVGLRLEFLLMKLCKFECGAH